MDIDVILNGWIIKYQIFDVQQLSYKFSRLSQIGKIKIINHISYLKAMRFFLRIKQGNRQIATKRIQLKLPSEATDDLLKSVALALNASCEKFIVKLLHNNYKLRILPGWTFSHYGIKAGKQLEVQLVSSGQQLIKKQSIDHSQPMESIPQISQASEKQEGEDNQIYEMAAAKYQELLKLIQKGNHNLFLKQLHSSQDSLGPCENEFYLQELKNILNELGAKGWAAIHYAIFSQNVETLNYLTQNGVDVNLKTSDEWLPIQLAIRSQNIKICEILLAQPQLNINLKTSHGLPLIMAVQSKNMELINRILKVDVNFEIKDHLDRVVFDVINESQDQHLWKLLKKAEQKHLNCQAYRSSQMFHTLVSLYRGSVTLIKAPPLSDKEYYLVLNPYRKSVQVYESPKNYPNNPKQIIDIQKILKFKILNKSQLSWYMKSEQNYFTIAHEKKKYVFCCDLRETCEKWVKSFLLTLQHIKSYGQLICSFVQNDSIIVDKLVVTSSPKKVFGKKDSLLSILSNHCEKSEPVQETEVKQSVDAKVDAKVEVRAGENSGNVESPEKVELKAMNVIEQNEQLKNGLRFVDFKIVRVLGEGSFGTVLLATDTRNPQKGKQYALKCFKKKKLVMNKQVKYTVAQINILKQLSHPFIVNLQFTFQTPNNVYLGLDYCSGKDLSHHIISEVSFPENDCKIYAAEVLLALEYLHQKNIIYRDLKPENIMIAEDGHVKLVDFGLCKQGARGDFVAKSFCGSPAYLSPEMLSKNGVKKYSDYYCLGAVLYEMLVGQPPFFSQDIQTLYTNIKCSKLTFPKNLSSDAKDFLSHILQRDPSKRLGYKSIDEIKQHDFFKSIDWKKLLRKQVKAPIREADEVEDEEENPVQIFHQDFDYSAQNYRINRFLNFTFVRDPNQECL